MDHKKKKEKIKRKPLPAGAANWLTLKKSLQKSKETTRTDKSQNEKSQGHINPVEVNSTRRLEACRQKRKETSTKILNNEKGKVSGTKEVWFNDMDIRLVNGEIVAKQQKEKSPLILDTSHTHHIALDCEMVMGGVKTAYYLMLGRCSIVNCHGNVIYDKYVRPLDRIAFYNTRYSGIKPCHLINAPDFKTVQNEVSSILDGRVLIGHALHNDFKVLFMSHPKQMIRDTSLYPPFKALSKGIGNTPSLKTLAMNILGLDIQNGSHDSVEDARAAMRLYQLHKKEWEKSILIQNRKILLKSKCNGFIGESINRLSGSLVSSLSNQSSSNTPLNTTVPMNNDGRIGSCVPREKDTSLESAVKKSISSAETSSFDKTAPLFGMKRRFDSSQSSSVSKKKLKRAKRKESKKEALLRKRLERKTQEDSSRASSKPFHIMLNSDL